MTASLESVIRVTWSLLKWLSVLVVGALLVAGAYLYHRLDEELRLHIEHLLAQKYPRLVVNVRAAQWVDGEGIEIRGLSILQPASSGPQAELLRIDEMLVYCGSDWGALARGAIDIHHVRVRNPTIRMTRRPDGSFTAAELLPIPQFGDEPPTGVIENAVVIVSDPQKAVPSSYSLRAERLAWQPLDAQAVGPGGRTLFRVTGTMAADHLRHAEMDLVLDPDGDAWTLDGRVEGLDIAPELGRSLPDNVARHFESWSAVRAQIQGQFRIAYAAQATTRWDFSAAGTIARGRIDDNRLPYPVTDLRANFRADREGVVLEGLTARHGQSILRLELNRGGYSDTSPLSLRFEARRLLVDAKVIDVLPPAWRDVWYDYLPAGEVDVDLALDFDGRSWRPEVTVTCHDVGFTYYRFPYRLEHGRGTIALKEQALKIDVIAFSHSEEVRIDGRLHFDQQQTYGHVEIRGAGLQIDEKLLAALEDQPREIVRSLHPTGRFNLMARFWRPPGGDPQIRRYLLLDFYNCTVRSDRFAYPLHHGRGAVEVRDGHWEFRDMAGVNDTGRVCCAGYLRPSDEGPELYLEFNATQVPLEEELREALPPAGRRVWSALKPRGAVNLQAGFMLRPERKVERLWVRAEPVDNGLTIEPAALPYRVENIHGVLLFDDGLVRMESLSGRHGRTTASGRGEFRLDRQGGWQLRLERLFVDRLQADRELTDALPERFRRLLASLRPGGTFNVRGTAAIDAAGPDAAPTADWDLEIDFSQNRLNCGVELTNINGGLNLVGRFDGQQFSSRGHLRLDSLTYKDCQITEVMGPLWIDEQRVLLGTAADRHLQVRPQRHLTAKLYGGTLLGDGWVVLAPQPRYALRGELVGASLARLAQEAIPGPQKLEGEIYAAVDLQGAGPSLNDLSGQGTVQLRNADIYELPVMVALLKILSIRPPDTTAFTRSDMKFRVEGPHIYIDQIDFNGDAVSLFGKGELGLDGQVRLVFHPILGNDQLKIPVVRELLGGAGQQIMLIHVDGTLSQPITRRQALPGVNQALQQLQAEFQGPPGTTYNSMTGQGPPMPAGGPSPPR